MSRKSNAQREDGRYQRVVCIGKDPETGKRIQKIVMGKTDREAQEKAEELRAMYKKGIDISAQQDTFLHWYELWLKTKSCGDGQLSAYKSTLKHIMPYIEQTPIAKIKSYDLQLAINEIAEKELSVKTMRMLLQGLSQIFRLAKTNHVIDSNPAEDLEIPSTAVPAEEREPIADEQIGWVINTPHRVRIAALILMYTGIRRGELFALRRSDVDLDKATMRIRRTVEARKGREKKGGKTKNAYRDVIIPEPLCEELRKHFAAQDKREIQPADPLVFPQATREKQNTASSWSRAWDSYICDLNVIYGYAGENVSKFDPQGLPMRIERFTAHQLRHTYASVVYEAGVDVLSAQHLLGHAKASTTMDIYTHLRNKSMTEQREKINDFWANRKD